MQARRLISTMPYTRFDNSSRRDLSRVTCFPISESFKVRKFLVSFSMIK